MNRLYCVLIFLLGASQLAAQEIHSLEKHREMALDTVTVQGNRRNTSKDVVVSIRVTPLDEQLLQENRARTLSELLSENTGLYIKSMGQGALSTSSFRGTGSGHTQVNWNGMEINPNMSSSFDFSQIPVFFVDQLTLYHGNGYIKGGTGGLGGSVNLSNSPQWQDSTRMRALVQVGANETYTGGVAARFLGQQTLYQTRLYYQQSENNYRYLNKVFSKDPFYERRKDARYQQAGLMQQAHYKAGQYATLGANLWVQYGDRHLPQPITVNHIQHEEQQDLGAKYMMEYNYHKGRHQAAAKVGYLFDQMDYSRWLDGRSHFQQDRLNRSHSLQGVADYTYTPSLRLVLNSSWRYTYDRVHAASYNLPYVHRHVFALQQGALWQVSRRFLLQAQLMGEVTDQRFAPTFSSGGVVQLASRLTAKAGAAYNYKFPSLNDLYWEPGGNPLVRSERGFSYDATLCYTPKIGGSTYLRSEVTGYWMEIDDWIMWLPSQSWYWEPRNVQHVRSRGIEALLESTTHWNSWRFKASLNYTLAQSVNREQRFAQDNSCDKQLPYVPLHKGNVRLGLYHRIWFFTYQITHTGKRYTTSDESYSTPAYFLHDVVMGCDIRLKQRRVLTPTLRIDNLLNAYYESTQYYPMPLQMVSGSVTFTF